MKEKLRPTWELIRQSFKQWGEDSAAQWAASIAYFTIFSISPIILIALTIAGQFFNRDVARNQLLAQIGNFMGQDVASFIASVLENSARSSNNLMASLISSIVLLIGASGIFNQIQLALNKIWDVPPRPHSGWINNLRSRFLSFLMVLIIGFLLLLFIIVSAVASYINQYFYGNTPNAFLSQGLNLLILFVGMTILFAMVYRNVPDKEITWTDVWLGAVITSLLLMVGRLAIGFYLSISRSGSIYGAAGSLIVLLIWVYYSAQIFLLGAEFTHVYAKKFGSHKNIPEHDLPQPDHAHVKQSST